MIGKLTNITIVELVITPYKETIELFEEDGTSTYEEILLLDIDGWCTATVSEGTLNHNDFIELEDRRNLFLAEINGDVGTFRLIDNCESFVMYPRESFFVLSGTCLIDIDYEPINTKYKPIPSHLR